jgi:YgiT-type zinc finger domain-containing protein
MKTKQNSKSYWKDETCETCGGTAIMDKEVEVYRHRAKKRYLFQKVPAGVCSDCGTRYFTSNVAKMMEEKLRRGEDKKAKKTITITVLSF